MATSKEKINPMAPGSLKGRAPGVEPMRQDNAQQSGQLDEESGVGERGGVASQQTGWAARQHAVEGEQDQHAGSQESATGPAGKRQTDEARPKLSRARKSGK